MNKDKNDIEGLKGYIKHLEKRVKNLETEKQLMDKELHRLEIQAVSSRNEIDSLGNELDRLREPPLIGGIIIKEDPINSGRCIILTSTGFIAIVNASENVKDKLEFGTYIALNQRTFAIMDVLNLNEEDVINAAKKLASHTIFRERD